VDVHKSCPKVLLDEKVVVDDKVCFLAQKTLWSTTRFNSKVLIDEKVRVDPKVCQSLVIDYKT